MSAACFAPRRLWASLLAAGVAAIWHGAAICQPSTLYLHSAIYDPARQRMVVFAGYDDATSTPTNGAWQFTLDRDPRWDPLSPAGILPAKRFGHSAVYHPVGDRMLVFGGDTSNVSADVWALSLANSTWSSLQPSGTSPLARRYHTAIYDPLRDRMLVFGGDHGLGTWLNDVWSLWLTPTPRWEPLTPSGTSPLSRYGHSAIYDPARDRMVVFGGSGPLNDVWALSLGDTAWTLLPPSGNPPLPRLGHSAVYDPSADRMIVFGGTDGDQPLDEVWQLSLTDPLPTWSPFISATDSPSPRGYHSAVYDSVYRRMVVFGGFPPGEPTWALAPGQAMRWSPLRPVIQVSATELQLPTVTVGDTVSVPFLISNLGLEPLQVTSFRLPTALSLRPPDPFNLAWNEAAPETLFLAAVGPQPAQDSVVIMSNDPLVPRRRVNLSIDVRGLDFETRVLGAPLEAPLGVSLLVVATPKPGVRVERGTLYYRIADGTSAFDSRPLTPLSTDFIAAIPAAAVTEHGLEYYAKVENSGIMATQPPGAPDSTFSYPVASPTGILSVAQADAGGGYPAGRPTPVIVSLPEGSHFERGHLFYRAGGEAAYDSLEVALVELAPGIFSPADTIPGEAVGPRGLEYWVRVQTLTRTLTDPASNAAQSPRTVRTNVSSLAESLSHAGGRYRMISVPLDLSLPATATLEAILSNQPEFGPYEATRWRSYRYLPETGGYVELSLAAAAGGALRPEPGRAFWLIAKRAHQIDTDPVPGRSTPTDAPYRVTLGPGWNQVGNPFLFPVAWSAVTAEGPSGPVALEPPVAWDEAQGKYREEDVTVLAPFEGYWVWNPTAQPVDLLIPPDQNGTGPATGAALAAAESRDSTAWRLQLTAVCGAASDSRNFAGVTAAAREGEDALDRADAPLAPGAALSLYFLAADASRRTIDLRPPFPDTGDPAARGQRWAFDLVRTGEEALPPEVRLAFTGREAVPADVELRLIDRTLERMVDLRQQADYTFVAARREFVARAAEARFELIAGTPAFIEAVRSGLADRPLLTRLLPSFPNPVVSTAIIRFETATPGRVRLALFDLAGRRVKTLMDEEREPGRYELAWQGGDDQGRSLPPGVYALRLAAPDRTDVRKLVRIR
jgi:hypothetical protein